jgi:transcriptional regulator with XRE-family HTH domain
MAQRGWRQGDLAGLVGVSQQTASRWLAGRSVPARSHVESLALVLGHPLEEVFRRCEGEDGR